MASPETVRLLVNALRVFAVDPRLRDLLNAHDPKALQQAEAALLAFDDEARASAVLAPDAPLTPPKRWGKVVALTPEDFAQDMIAVIEPDGCTDARTVLLRIKQRRRCHKLVVNGRPAGLAEVKQMSARLAREGKIAMAVA